jgi:hypothetical protein
MESIIAAYVVKWQDLNGKRPRPIDPTAVVGLRGSGAVPVLAALLTIGLVAAVAGQLVS